jgi:hypothetical protein
LAQALLAIEWPLLARWQEIESYKLSSGALLAAFLLGQWFLTLARVRGWRLARGAHVWHQRLGAVAPVFLFAHSTRFGFGYLLMLSGVFLLNTCLGCLSPRVLPRLRGYFKVWLPAHIALSVTLVILAGYHGWVALYFE